MKEALAAHHEPLESTAEQSEALQIIAILIPILSSQRNTFKPPEVDVNLPTVLLYLKYSAIHLSIVAVSNMYLLLFSSLCTSHKNVAKYIVSSQTTIKFVIDEVTNIRLRLLYTSVRNE